MQYEFLNNFVRRMKIVGQHRAIIAGSGGKAIWKEYGFETEDSQLVMVYAVMLYIMEQDLKTEPCIIDDIASFVDDINASYFRKPMGEADCARLGDFIVNNVLSNEGRPMYFEAYDFETSTIKPIHISYIANRSIYTDKGVRRTSYYMTEDGMSMLFSMLEFEDNLKLPVKEFIFRMHLEKQSYEKAVEEIRDIFVLLRMQVQKTRESIERIRRNVLEYSATEYKSMKTETLDAIDKTRRKFEAHRETVSARIREIEQSQISLAMLDDKDKKNLELLQTIGEYLNRALSEYQTVYGGYFDLSAVYSDELEKIREIGIVQRVSYRTDIFDRFVKNPEGLKNVGLFLKPLLNRDPDSLINMRLFFEEQQTRKEENTSGYILDTALDEEYLEREKERFRKKRRKYRTCTETLLSYVVAGRNADLSDICRMEEEKDHYRNLVPDINVFKSIISDFREQGVFNISKIQKERKTTIEDSDDDLRLGILLADILDSHPEWEDVSIITAEKIMDALPVIMEGVKTDTGVDKRIRLNDMRFTVTGANQSKVTGKA